MLKVFLVEDEVVIREGIKKKIEWEENGLRFVGEASDGELAYPLIQQSKPDIIITDIKMPFMDGLELSRLVKKEMPKVKIIVLSGHDEFEYAKEAINIGITDFLVKPFSSAKLLQAIKQVAKMIYEEKEQLEFMEQYLKERQENLMIERQTFFEELVSKKMSVSSLLEKGKKLNMDLSAGAYNIILFEIFVQEDLKDQYFDIVVDLEEELTHMIGQATELILFDRGLEGKAILVKTINMDELVNVQSEWIKKITQEVEKHRQVEYFIGLGVAVNRLLNIPDSFDKANKMFAYRYIADKNQVFQYDSRGNELGSSNREFSLKSINISKTDKTALDKFLRSGSKGEVWHFIEDYLASIGSETISSLLFRQYVTMNLNLAILGFIEELEYDTEKFIEKCGDINQIIPKIASIEGTKEYLKMIIIEAICIRDVLVNQKYNNILEQAKLFIKENYNHKDISLNTVAANVNTSPNYFSTLFSQEIGQTFIEYLTNVRMEKAKELLICTNKKVADISYEVGYNDPHYFSYLFKKINGCTTKTFRVEHINITSLN